MHNSNYKYTQMVFVMQKLEQNSAPFVDINIFVLCHPYKGSSSSKSNNITATLHSDNNVMSPGNVTFLGQMFLYTLEHFIHPLKCVIVFAYAHKQFVSLVSSIMLRRKKERLINCIKRLCENCVCTYVRRTMCVVYVIMCAKSA